MTTKVDTKREGVISHWNPTKRFGFLVSKVEGSTIIERFFIHEARINICDGSSDEIQAGYFVKFNVSPISPKRGQAPFAIDVEVYKANPALAGIGALAGKTSSTEGAQ
jgi:hypothetical protein